MLDANATPLGEQSTLATTKGWDTVYAIKFADVNNAIVRHNSSPRTFASPPLTRAGDRIDGDFGHWRMSGGAGRLVAMTLPVPQGFLRSYNDSLVEIDVIERREMSFTIEVQLSCLPQPEDETDNLRAAAPGVPHALKLHLPNMAGPFGASVVRVLDCVYPKDPGSFTQPASTEELEEVNKELFIQYMSNWLNDTENLREFNHTFAVVNINEKASTGAFDWLMPKYVSYGVLAGATEDTGTFAILCMTEEISADRPIPDSQEISPNIIPDGQNSAFLISKERFMRKLLLPHMTENFAAPSDVEEDPRLGRIPNYPQDYFELAANGSLLRNTRPIVVPEFQGREEDKPVEARLGRNGLNLVLEDTYLDVRFEGFTHPFWWFWYEAVHNMTVHVEAGLNEHGRFILMPPDDVDDTDLADHTAVLTKTDAAQTVDDILLALDVIMILAGAAKLGWGAFKGGKVVKGAGEASRAASLVGETTQTAVAGGEATIEAGVRSAQGAAKLPNFFARNVGKIHVGLVAAMTGAFATDKICEIIAENDDWAKNRIPEFGEFAAQVMSPIAWPGSTDFAVTDVTFNGSFQVSGDPLFPVVEETLRA